MQQSKSIVGTWRLQTYQVWSAEGEVSSPLGDSPIGYAVFDGAGHAFVQLSRGFDAGATLLHSEVVREELANSFTAYFGTYTVSPDTTKLKIEVQGSNRAAYIGSTQEREVSIAADTLTMGQPNQYRAVLHRRHP